MTCTFSASRGRPIVSPFPCCSTAACAYRKRAQASPNLARTSLADLLLVEWVEIRVPGTCFLTLPLQGLGDGCCFLGGWYVGLGRLVVDTSYLVRAGCRCHGHGRLKRNSGGHEAELFDKSLLSFSTVFMVGVCSQRPERARWERDPEVGDRMPCPAVRPADGRVELRAVLVIVDYRIHKEDPVPLRAARPQLRIPVVV